MRKALIWLGIAFAALVAVPLLVLIAINLPDEDLAPEAAAYGVPGAPSVPEAENGHYALLALNASDGEDAMAYARAWVDEARSAAREDRAEKLPATRRAQRPALCDPRKTQCFVFALNNRAEAERQLEAFKEDLARYERLLAYKRYEEVLDYRLRTDSALPPHGALGQGQRAYLLRIAVAVAAGRTEEALAALERELAWQRAFLSGSRLLIGKMVAAENTWRDLMFIAELVQAKPAEMLPFAARLQALLAPLDGAPETRAALETEFRFARAAFDEAASGQGEKGSFPERIVIALLFKRNATLNRAFRQFASLSGTVFEQPAHRAEAGWEAFSKAWLDRPLWEYVYNPAGKVIIEAGALGWKDYPYRAHDLVALSRLLALRVELLAAGVTAEQVPQAIAASAERLRDPYTLKPMRWDAAKRRIYFDAKGERSRVLAPGVEKGRVYVEL
jgi:hypothetical protein